MAQEPTITRRTCAEIAADIRRQLTNGHNAGRSITQKLALEALAALESQPSPEVSES